MRPTAQSAVWAVPVGCVSGACVWVWVLRSGSCSCWLAASRRATIQATFCFLQSLQSDLSCQVEKGRLFVIRRPRAAWAACAPRGRSGRQHPHAHALAVGRTQQEPAGPGPRRRPACHIGGRGDDDGRVAAWTERVLYSTTCTQADRSMGRLNGAGRRVTGACLHHAAQCVRLPLRALEAG